MTDGGSYYLYNRNWMYEREFDVGSFNIEFIKGLEEFIKFALSKSRSSKIRCPCAKCKNVVFKNPNDVREHLLRKGFVEHYYDWRYHYDIAAGEGSSGNNAFARQQLPEDVLPEEPIAEENNYARMVHDAAASRFPDAYENIFPQNEYGYVEAQSPEYAIPEEPNPEAKKFFQMFSAANNPLYEGCENYSQMSIIGRMTNLKTEHNCSERLYDDMCTLMR